MPTSNNNDTRKRRTEENFTEYKSIQNYSVTESVLKKAENNLESFPEKAGPLVQAVFDIVDSNGEQNNLTICKEAKNYFNNCNDDNRQKRIGVYYETGFLSLSLFGTMEANDKAVFDSILNIISDKKESIKKAVLEPIADAIELELQSKLAQLITLRKEDITVEPIIKNFFEQAFQITGKTNYLFYVKAKEHNGKELWDEYSQRREKSDEFTNECLKRNKSVMYRCIDSFCYIVLASIVSMVFLSILYLMGM